MLKYSLFLIIGVIFINIGCTENKNNNFHESVLLQNSKLVCVDSVKHFYTKNSIIGRLYYIYAFNNYFFLVDSDNKKMWIFDSSFNLVKSLVGYGKGPGEFINSPQIVFGTKNLVLFEAQTKAIYFYDSDFNLIESNILDKSVIYHFSPSLFLNGKYYFSVTYPYSVVVPEYYKKFKPAVILDKNFNIVSTFTKWDDIFFDSKLFTYACHNHETLFSLCDSNSFFLTQQASPIYYKYNKNNEIVEKFGREFKYFKKPPSGITPSQVQASFDTAIDYFAKVTSKKTINYDPDTKNLCVGYKNSSIESFRTRDRFSNTYYLQIYNSEYDVIFDEKINGIFLFSYKGKIYVLENDTPEYFLIRIYKLAKI